MMLISRLFYIQIFWADELSEKAQNQQNKSIIIPPKRGVIYDRKGDKLAFSIKTYSLWAHAAGITRPDEIGELLASLIELDGEGIADQIKNANNPYVRVARNLTHTDAQIIKSAGIRGITVAEDVRRIYPYNHLASHLLGNVNADGNGFLGIEFFYNEMLKGEEGRMYATTDSKGRQLALRESSVDEPIDGYDLWLTLDDTIQFLVEKRLEDVMADFDAKSASALVMNPQTGEIIAMASKPDFDLNNPRAVNERLDADIWESLTLEERVEYWNEQWQNPVISHTYEPGSTMKAFTAAVALETGAVTRQTQTYCPGFHMVNGVRLRCWNFPHAHGNQNLEEAFANSCNPSFIQISEKIGVKAFYEYLEKLKLLDRTGIDLPAESRSVTIPQEQVGPIEFATLSYGHGINATMLQVATATSAMVNGGYLMQPYVVSKAYDHNGQLVFNQRPVVLDKVFSDSTSDSMKKLFQAAVENGGSRRAAIPGIDVGGKTGTTLKMVDGNYSDEHVIASFVGMAPLESPEYLVIVVVDEPKSRFAGSHVAAPLGGQILSDIFRYNHVTPLQRHDLTVEVPDLKGKNYQEAVLVLEQKNIHFTTDPLIDPDDQGSWIIVDQFPKAGQNMSQNTLLILSIIEE